MLFEDKALLILDKPSGLPTIPPDSSRAHSLLDAANAIIRARDPAGRAAVVHRVDRDTSGVVMFAKSGRGKRELMGAWNELVVERAYLALVEGRPEEDEGRIEDWLIENKAGTVYRGAAGERGALRAVTRWRLVETGPRYSLITATLETGRKHQVRVHLAGLGCPLVGDERYGARTDPLGRVCLHAAVLEFRHPFTDELLRVESPLPPDFRRLLHAPDERAQARAGSGGIGGRGKPGQSEGSGRRGAAGKAANREPRARSGPAKTSKPPKQPRREAPEWAPRHVKKRP